MNKPIIVFISDKKNEKSELKKILLSKEMDYRTVIQENLDSLEKAIDPEELNIILYSIKLKNLKTITIPDTLRHHPVILLIDKIDDQLLTEALADWADEFMDRAIDSVSGRLHEPITLEPKNAWIKRRYNYDWREGGYQNMCWRNMATGVEVEIPKENWNDTYFPQPTMYD